MRNRDTTGTEHYASVFGALPSAPAWIEQTRAEAMARLQEHGFPGTRDEDWKYTRPRPMLQQAFAPVIGKPAPFALGGQPWQVEGAQHLVFVDGLYDHDHSAREFSGALTVGSLASGLAEAPDVRERLGTALGGEPLGFDALNTAFLRDGAVIHVPRDHDAGTLHLVNVSTGGGKLGTLRHVVILEPGATLRLVEHQVGAGEGSSLTSVVTELFVGHDATVEHVKVLADSAEAYHVATVAMQLDRGATVRGTSFATGAALARVELRALLEGEGSTADLAGLTLARGREHVDHHVLVDHAVPHGTSRQTFRSIVDGRARSVFTGKVVVREGAQKTDSEQSNHNLLLSDDAVANTRPQLEIYADDVKCAHGATVGRLDPDALFYLRARGLSELEARGLLTTAFAAEVVGRLPEGALRTFLDARVRRWLEG